MIVLLAAWGDTDPLVFARPAEKAIVCKLLCPYDRCLSAYATTSNSRRFLTRIAQSICAPFRLFPSSNYPLSESAVETRLVRAQGQSTFVTRRCTCSQSSPFLDLDSVFEKPISTTL